MSVFSRIKGRFSIKFGHLGANTAWSCIGLAFCHLSSIKQVKDIPGLSKMKSCCISSGLNSKEVCEGAKVFHGKINLQLFDNGGESF